MASASVLGGLPAGDETEMTDFAVAAAAYFSYEHHRISAQNHQETREWSKNILEATQKNTRAIRAQTFVLTLSQERREKLNLEVPEEIREMQRHREP